MTLTLIVFVKSSNVCGTSFLKLYTLNATPMPAQFTKLSNFPNLSFVAWSASLTSFSNVTYN